jgi:hypothetical protein
LSCTTGNTWEAGSWADAEPRRWDSADWDDPTIGSLIDGVEPPGPPSDQEYWEDEQDDDDSSGWTLHIDGQLPLWDDPAQHQLIPESAGEAARPATTRARSVAARREQRRLAESAGVIAYFVLGGPLVLAFENDLLVRTYLVVSITWPMWAGYRWFDDRGNLRP